LHDPGPLLLARLLWRLRGGLGAFGRGLNIVALMQLLKMLLHILHGDVSLEDGQRCLQLIDLSLCGPQLNILVRNFLLGPL